MKRLYNYVAILFFLFPFAIKAQTTVDLKAFLEGPYNGSQMNASLNTNGYLPLTHPYNTAPWNYQGTESVAAIPNADVVDWVLVELRETAGNASTAYEGDSIASQAGFILKNGNIVSTDGISPMQFSNAVTMKLYAVIYQRNHLPVLSGGQLILNAGIYSWNYSIGENQAYGGSLAHKQIASGIWGMCSGDGDANGQINNSDKNEVWKPQSGSSGYKSGDFNMNGQVDNLDKIEFWQVNSGKSSQVLGEWSCGKPVADSRDGQIYTTIQISSQCWMAENLNIGIMIPGANDMTNNGIIEKYCYNYNPANCDDYGGLYQWNEMMQYSNQQGIQGICLSGWSIPTQTEWTSLIDVLGGNNTSGGKMKETGYTYWLYPNTGATNSSGFTARGGGFRVNAANFDDLWSFAYIWSSSQIDNNDAWYRQLHYNNAQTHQHYGSKLYGLSVRCLKD